ncbi:MAG: transporter, CPA2 family [Rhodobacteraceae bacterium HLUCCO07]|nr:MAG: transporter, CPA2 family [Rhodobacteraceae bacterium HLUCCO07]
MDLGPVLVTLGALFLIGLAADSLGRHTRLPRVTLLLLCGIAVGGSGFDLIPAEMQVFYDFLSVMALTMVAFLLGNSLRRETLARHGAKILVVSLVIVLLTFTGVSVGLWLAGLPTPVALVLGAIATATAPEATHDAIRQSGADGPFVDVILGIVAINDAWGLLAFSLAMAGAAALNGAGDAAHLWHAAWEVGGAIALGTLIGLPAAYLTGRLKPGEALESEAFGIVCLTAGLAIWLGISFLVAGMVAGALISNLARHHDRAFDEIEHLEWPFMMLFFLLAGAKLDLSLFVGIGGIGLLFIALRGFTRVLGGWIGGRLAGVSPRECRWMGAALLPQAGVAVGMALIATQSFPDHGELILTLTIGATVAFELIGPVMTTLAVRRISAGNTADASGRKPL